MLSVTIRIVARAISFKRTSFSALCPTTKGTISAMSSAWSPMRSISVIIFRAAEICRRSRATGCCSSSRRKHMASMSRSFWSISPSRGATFLAKAAFPSVSAWLARAMTSSQRAPISIISLFS